MEKTNYRSEQSLDENIMMAVVRAAEIFKRMFSAIFRKYNLSFPQYNILRVLDASKDGQSRITDVSRIMLVPGANMTGLAKRLEKNGFITRKSDPKRKKSFGKHRKGTRRLPACDIKGFPRSGKTRDSGKGQTTDQK